MRASHNVGILSEAQLSTGSVSSTGLLVQPQQVHAGIWVELACGIDAGDLDESWRQQPGTPVYAKDFGAAGVRHALSKANKDRTPEWRASSNSPGSFTTPA